MTKNTASTSRSTASSHKSNATEGWAISKADHETKCWNEIEKCGLRAGDDHHPSAQRRGFVVVRRHADDDRGANPGRGPAVGRSAAGPSADRQAICRRILGPRSAVHEGREGRAGVRRTSAEAQGDRKRTSL